MLSRRSHFHCCLHGDLRMKFDYILNDSTSGDLQVADGMWPLIVSKQFQRRFRERERVQESCQAFRNRF